jgi:ABC-type sugar transport system permease subunit
MLVLFLVFVILPLFTALGLSFFSWRFLNTPTWVGLDNFEHILRDRALPRSIVVTGLFVAMGVLPTILIGFILSVLINVKLRGIALMRMLYFVPIVVSVSVNAVLWRFIYDTRRGPLGAIGRQLGLDLPSVLDTTQWALPGLVVIMIWAGLPLVIIFYLAALQRISEDLYAAASLDGAGPWRMMWSITWPNVATTTWLLLVLEIVFFSAGSLDFARATTDGGPLDATTSLGLYAFKTAFERRDVGYSSVLSLVQMVVIVAVAGLLLFVARVRRR